MGKHAARPEGAPTTPTSGSSVSGSSVSGSDFPGSPPTTSSGRFWAGVRETTILLVLALGLAVVLRTFIVQAFFVPSESMVPALLKDDRIVVSKLSTDLGGVDRGEVVVFRDPGDWLDPPTTTSTGLRKTVVSAMTFIGLLPSDTGDDLVKRVIGVGGDRVVCCDDQGRITVNGVALDESSYLDAGDAPSQTPFDIVVPDGDVWVMGDNRSNSQDSRYHEEQRPGGGMVPVDNVIGRAVAVVWPADHWRLLPVPPTFEDIPPGAAPEESAGSPAASR